MNSVDIEITDFEMINKPDMEIQNSIRRLFDEIVEKDNRTSEFKRQCRIWKRISSEMCNDCLESIVRCYQFGTNEVNQLSFQLKEKYSEQVNGDSGAFDIEMGLGSPNDMYRD